MLRAVCIITLTLTAAGAQAPELVEKSRRAKEAMGAERYEEAVPLYRELVAALPSNPGMRMNLALALHSSGRYREAIPQFRAALAQQPGLTPGWLMLGLAYLKVGDPAQAIEPLSRVVRAEPANPQARLELADAYLSTGRPAEALPHFTKLTELDPLYPKAWQGLGLAYIALSQQSFHSLEQAAPDSPLRLLLLARSAAERGQSRSAMRLYREAITKAPQLRFAHAGLAEVYRKTDHADWARAEDQLERDLLPPNCATSPLECAFLAGRYDEVLRKTSPLRTPEAYYWKCRACEHLTQQAFARLSALPPSAAIHELLADAARIQRNYAQAAEHWREALKLAPEDRRLEKGLAQALWLNRDYESARPLLEKLVKLEPDSSELQLQLGDTLLAQNADQALPHLKNALRLAPASPRAHAALGRAYMRLGQPNLAVPHLKAALSLDQDGKLSYQLAQAYTRTGQPQLAREAMEKYKSKSAVLRATQPALDEDEQ